MLASLFSLVVCIGSILFNPTAGASYESRIVVEPKGFVIQPITQATGYKKGTRDIRVDTSVFDDTGIKPQTCSNHNDVYCLQWQNKTDFKITRINEHCEMYEMSTELKKPLSVTFSLEGVHLYGGTQTQNQTWPTQKTSFNDNPYVRMTFWAQVTNDKTSQDVLERYWLDSAGRYIYVDKTVPLFLTQNETTLLLTAEIREPYIRKTNKTTLKYRYCAFENAKIAHLDAIANVFAKPSWVPDRRMVQYPIWSTWAVYKTNVSESNVYEYANSIKQHNFPNSALEIDDMWETCYGSLTIDTKKFPDMKRHVYELKRLGFRVTLWAHPFINVGCEPAFSIARESGYFVKGQNGSLNAHWWNGDGAMIDFTNPNAAKWFTNRLKKVQNETGLDSFKFDSGEYSYLAQAPVYANMSEDHPDTFIRAYLETLNQFGNMIEVRVASGVQDISPWIRMNDRNTKWSGPLAFDTMIPTLLQMNIVGYPFVMPDMIGGNSYAGDVLTEEMYVRWVQMNVFMPVLQFSLPPWVFSTEALEITKKCIDLHAKYADKINELMDKAVKDGTPVNTPLWWVDPTDSNTHAIDSEFLLGENILVAPVVKEGARTRDIYIPKGQWRDENKPGAPTIKGPVMLHNYKAELDVLPYFTRVDGDHDKNSSAVMLPGLFCIGTVVTLLTLIIRQ